MRKQIKNFRDTWNTDYQFSTLVSSAVSAVINTAFTFYNGILGIVYQSFWNGSICVYYLFLAVIRIILIATRKKNNRKVYIATHIMLIVMDILLIVPIAVMVKGNRSYAYGLIPAIAMAAYTTYRITMAIIHFRKSGKSDSILVLELRTINLTDALIAVLSLQNALIIANGGMNGDMLTLTAWTSGGIFIVIVVFTIKSLLASKKA